MVTPTNVDLGDKNVCCGKAICVVSEFILKYLVQKKQNLTYHNLLLKKNNNEKLRKTKSKEKQNLT